MLVKGANGVAKQQGVKLAFVKDYLKRVALFNIIMLWIYLNVTLLSANQPVEFVKYIYCISIALYYVI